MGKGEKGLSYNLLMLLAKSFGVAAVMQVLELLPSFGYWKDLVHLLAMPGCPSAIADKCVALLSELLRADEDELAKATAEAHTATLSLVAK